MKKLLVLLPVFLFVTVAHAASDGATRYVTDQIKLALHLQPSSNSGSIGVIQSGDQVTVLRSLGPNSYTQVRAANGKKGWVPTHDLSTRPAARTQLNSYKKQLDEANAQITALKRKLDAARQQLSKVKPALSLAADNAKLHAEIARRDKQFSALKVQYNIDKAHRNMLMTGAALAIGGIILGLLLPWLTQGRKRRRYSDF